MSRATAAIAGGAPAGAAQAAEFEWPADAVEVGRVAGAWGVKGWIKVQPHAADPQALLHATHWFLQAGPSNRAASNDTAASRLTIVQARSHGEQVIASVAELSDREAAQALSGCRVFVPRATFPPLSRDEYYWVDLVGATVVNRQGQTLGTVASLLDTGAHSVLCVAPGQPGVAERLIPFVAAYVDAVDLAARRVVVDWGLDY